MDDEVDDGSRKRGRQAGGRLTGGVVARARRHACSAPAVGLVRLPSEGAGRPHVMTVASCPSEAAPAATRRAVGHTPATRGGGLASDSRQRDEPFEPVAKRADNSTLYAPPPTLGLQRIGRDSPKSAALIH
jgi:hypothetical protein